MLISIDDDGHEPKLTTKFNRLSLQILPHNLSSFSGRMDLNPCKRPMRSNSIKYAFDSVYKGVQVRQKAYAAHILLIYKYSICNFYVSNFSYCNLLKLDGDLSLG